MLDRKSTLGVSPPSHSSRIGNPFPSYYKVTREMSRERGWNYPPIQRGRCAFRSTGRIRLRHRSDLPSEEKRRVSDGSVMSYRQQKRRKGKQRRRSEKKEEEHVGKRKMTLIIAVKKELMGEKRRIRTNESWNHNNAATCNEIHLIQLTVRIWVQYRNSWAESVFANIGKFEKSMVKRRVEWWIEAAIMKRRTEIVWFERVRFRTNL